MWCKAGRRDRKESESADRATGYLDWWSRTSDCILQALYNEARAWILTDMSSFRHPRSQPSAFQRPTRPSAIAVMWAQGLRCNRSRRIDTVLGCGTSVGAKFLVDFGSRGEGGGRKPARSQSRFGKFSVRVRQRQPQQVSIQGFRYIPPVIRHCTALRGKRSRQS